MSSWMKPIILHYLIELNHEAPVDDEELEYRADGIVYSLKKCMAARRDFDPRNEKEA